MLCGCGWGDKRVGGKVRLWSGGRKVECMFISSGREGGQVWSERWVSGMEFWRQMSWVGWVPK